MTSRIYASAQLVISSAILVCSCVIGCSSRDTDPMPIVSLANAAVVDPDSVGATFDAFYIEVRQRSASDVDSRLNHIAESALERTIPANDRTSVLPAMSTRRANDIAFAALGDGLGVSYTNLGDQSSYWNDSVMRDENDRTDVGQSRAEAVFRRITAKLISSGIIDATGMDLKNPGLSHIMRGAGRGGQAPVEWISEYTFFVPRKVNGLALVNGSGSGSPAGLQVSIHRTGAVSRVSVSGHVVHSDRSNASGEMAKAPGKKITRQVARKDIDASVHARYLGATITDLGLQYRLSDETASEVVAPKQAYAVSTNTEINGKTVHGRVQYVSYSIQDQRDPELWPIPNPTATGDKRP